MQPAHKIGSSCVVQTFSYTNACTRMHTHDTCICVSVWLFLCRNLCPITVTRKQGAPCSPASSFDRARCEAHLGHAHTTLLGKHTYRPLPTACCMLTYLPTRHILTSKRGKISSAARASVSPQARGRPRKHSLAQKQPSRSTSRTDRLLQTA